MTTTLKPSATATIALHAATHPHEAVFGILVGKDAKTIEKAIPVSHGRPPTTVLLELALAWTTEEVVGCYEAPALLEDSRPSPVVLRVAAALDGALVVLNNKALGPCVKEGKASNDLLQAYGKDFADQYLEKITTKIEQADSTSQAIQKAYSLVDLVEDLQDHLDSASKNEWRTNAQLDDLIHKHCTS